MKPRVSVVITARDEGEAIVPVLSRVTEAVKLPCEILVVCDSTEDTTVPWVQKYAREDHRVRLVINDYGRGPARAIRAGFDASSADVVVVTMADGCDDPQQIDQLTRLVERGVVVAAASRYSKGGQQVGGPLLKGLMSRTAGASLKVLARVGTWDPTNSFKAYDRHFVEEVGIDSDKGFEVGLELVAKARRLRRPVAEVPTIWLDRNFGVSHFKVAQWLPEYLRWYWFAFGPRLEVDQMRRLLSAKGPGPNGKGER
ncbi:MAG: glycosyltransferase [Actinobacteria bacterium]|nr:glycosyltransferase [Actinomycetota bacterium]